MESSMHQWQSLPPDYASEQWDWNCVEEAADDIYQADSASPAGDTEGSSASTPRTTKEEEARQRRRERNQNASAEVMAKRRAQNREAQRTFRQRKASRIKELEQNIAHVTDENDRLSNACETIRRKCADMRSSQLVQQESWYLSHTPPPDFAPSQYDKNGFPAVGYAGNFNGINGQNDPLDWNGWQDLSQASPEPLIYHNSTSS